MIHRWKQRTSFLIDLLKRIISTCQNELKCTSMSRINRIAYTFLYTILYSTHPKIVCSSWVCDLIIHTLRVLVFMQWFD